MSEEGRRPRILYSGPGGEFLISFTEAFGQSAEVIGPEALEEAVPIFAFVDPRQERGGLMAILETIKRKEIFTFLIVGEEDLELYRELAGLGLIDGFARRSAVGSGQFGALIRGLLAGLEVQATDEAERGAIFVLRTALTPPRRLMIVCHGLHEGPFWEQLVEAVGGETEFVEPTDFRSGAANIAFVNAAIEDLKPTLRGYRSLGIPVVLIVDEEQLHLADEFTPDLARGFVRINASASAVKKVVASVLEGHSVFALEA